MPNTKSAEKNQRKSERKRIFNLRAKKELKEQLKQLKALIDAKKKEEALSFFPTIQSLLDRLVKRKKLVANTANRKKKRLLKKIGKISSV
ncbi:30S ribosomal protein S20 [Candidatus Methylacidiphilum fumarolicum]|uniref:Small ribosomal subunit protein bS20 n=2 Tax=Candidatus Methylacidiphilum fumarolicum TaxID=591154 RepID=I0JW05_METFB|nr:30S ribosomal protein S20 [Candidatus Methylacidiphilum fumarolicum]MBW6415665.1 30S ribosomal protein S20 [Candidatus Methylacidiphilum fumarolicum]TFE66802.1 30S ribosomal protein S20 [Candidatus Methylacidiphilum fumarolicum]TFE71726.1 30S ribosomal protein S20 [Candidatus Methylacidiphilum fumarolicum]TFE73656.1 30S ribosomal protein S20 [Candidatus Methylacidiphilum fumarolicum]TFE77620.1 30S ribosomal protein S20 [Candidatus Methylacidiphilum fumarolicum]